MNIIHMKTIIFQTNEEKKTNLLLNLMRELKVKARILSEEDMEDVYLARLIDEGMKEKGEIPLARIRRTLRK